MEVKIVRVSDTQFCVQLLMDKCVNVVGVTETEDQARCLAQGVKYGITAVKSLIGTGPYFSGCVEEME